MKYDGIVIGGGPAGMFAAITAAEQGYRCLRSHGRWYPHHFKNFPQFVVVHTINGFGIVNKAKVGIFLELSCFFNDPMDFDNLISGSFAFSKSSLNIRKITVHILLKPGLETFEYYFPSV